MIGPFNFVASATDYHRETFRPLLQVLAAEVGSIIEPVYLVPKKLERMPVYAVVNGVAKHAYGTWKGYVNRTNRREVWYWEDLDHYSKSDDPTTAVAILTMAHEVMHVVDSDSLGKGEKADIRGLMDPYPTGWADTTIAGHDYKYFALPFETFAVYASAALVDFTDLGLRSDKPAFTTLYKRSIAAADWPKLKNIIL